MMNKFLITIVSCLLLSGCTSKWVKIRSNAEEYTSASASCNSLARQTFPVKNEVAQRTKYTTDYETCRKKDDCGEKKTRAVKRPEIESYVMDVNDGSRKQLFRQCMEEKGWEKQMQWI